MADLANGFITVFSAVNLLWVLLGALLGTLVGVLPGLGPAATVALLLPFTFYLSPTTSLIVLAGIYYGAQYGGAATSILLNIPGESATVVTCLDGYPLTQQGRAGQALVVSSLSAFVGGMIALVIFTGAAASLAEIGLLFGPPEQFMLAAMALAVGGSFGASALKGIMAACFGLLLAFVGADPVSGVNRFGFGIPHLYEGIDFVPVAVGLFAIGETFQYLSDRSIPLRDVPHVTFRSLIPSGRDIRVCKGSAVRGGLLGFFVGILPGVGPATASFMSYNLARRLSKTPEEFGRGTIEGVAAPEAAASAASVGAMLPMFALGIPGSATTAVLLGGLLTWGLQPGPLFMLQNAELVWTVIASLYLASAMLLLINLPGAIILARISRLPMQWLIPSVLAISLTGTYAAAGSLLGPILALVFGAVGYAFRQANLPIAPVVLALVLGEMLEQNLRRSLVLGDGNPLIFLQRPISVSILLLTVVFLAASMRRQRPAAQKVTAV